MGVLTGVDVSHDDTSGWRKTPFFPLDKLQKQTHKQRQSAKAQHKQKPSKQARGRWFVFPCYNLPSSIGAFTRRGENAQRFSSRHWNSYEQKMGVRMDGHSHSPLLKGITVDIASAGNSLAVTRYHWQRQRTLCIESGIFFMLLDKQSELLPAS